MKCFKGISLIFLICLIPFAKAEEKKESSKIELVPVYEKTFDDTIVDVIFDTATVTIEEAKKIGWKDAAFTEEERSKGKTKILYPRVLFLDDKREIRFYDKKGLIQNSLKVNRWEEYEEVFISAKHKYFLISGIPTEYNPVSSGGNLYDKKGTKICKIDGPTPIAVSDEGYTIAAYLDWQVPPEPGGSFFVQSPTGELLKTIENPDKEKTAPLFAQYSEDGEYAILVFKATTFPPTIVYLITKTGEILWKIVLQEYRFSARLEEMMVFSKKGVVMVLDKYDIKTEKRKKPYICFIDWQGNLEWQYTLDRRGIIILNSTKEEEEIFAVSEIGYIWCVELESGILVWKQKFDWAPGPGESWNWDLPRVTGFEISNRTLNIIAKQGTDKQISILYILDSEDGELLKEVDYPEDKISFGRINRVNGMLSIVNTTESRVSIVKVGVQK
jgi:hypothetical protein